MSAIFKGLARKIAEKTRESDENLKKRFVADFAKNQRLQATMEVAAEFWPAINDLELDPRTRVDSLDELIHSAAIFPGRIKQNPVYGGMVANWERAFGYWQNYALLDMEGILPEGYLPTIEVPLNDGTILVVKDKQSGSVLSKKEHDLRLSLFANVEMLPRGKKVYVWGVSDDRDVSEQYAMWVQTSPQFPTIPLKEPLPSSYSPDFLSKPQDKK